MANRNYVGRRGKVYSADEKKAYHLGRGYGAAKIGKRIACKTEAQKQSFRNGIKSVKG